MRRFTISALAIVPYSAPFVCSHTFDSTQCGRHDDRGQSQYVASTILRSLGGLHNSLLSFSPFHYLPSLSGSQLLNELRLV